MAQYSKIDVARTIEDHAQEVLESLGFAFSIQEMTARIEKSPVFKVIGSAQNIEEVPRVARMIKRAEESIRNKPKSDNCIVINNKEFEVKIRQILTEREKDF